MPQFYDQQAVDHVEAVLDASPATAVDVYEQTWFQSERAIATVAAHRAGSGGGGVVPGTVIPVADPAGATVDTTSYDNEVTGSGKLTTLVFPQDTGAIAIAIEGDDFPRYIITSDAKDGIYLGDGTVDPYGENGCAINYGPENGGQLELQVQAGVNQIIISDTGARIGTLPTSDPHAAGWLYTVAGVVHMSTG